MDVIPAALRTVLFGLAVIVTASCTTPAEPSLSAAPLSHTFQSADALAQAVLDSLARRDAEGLRQLALSETEFRQYVWPELPVSRPERNVPFDYAWGQMKQRSDGSLAETVARYGGKTLKFVQTRFTGETTAYQSFSVMRDSEIVAADETGKELILRLYGAAMVTGGRYKLYSFVVD